MPLAVCATPIGNLADVTLRVLEELRDADAVSICVPTPLRKTRDPDMSYVVDAATHVAEHAHPGLVIVLESTTYPGTTEEILLPRLEQAGFTVGQDVFLAFSPERIDPGNARYGVRNTPKVVGGATPACTEVVTALYTLAVEHVVPVVKGVILRLLAYVGPRVVDEDIETAAPLLGGAEQGVDRRLVGDVDGDRERLPADLLELANRGVGFRLVPSRHDDARARAGQAFRHAEADASVAAGHDRDFALEIEHRSLPGPDLTRSRATARGDRARGDRAPGPRAPR